jgi:predicted polyphosphate/ATP-dependent NAD kinase
MKRLRIGLIINPIAGMGGAVGLKGTDGPEILSRAIELGATPYAGVRVERMLADITELRKEIHFLTAPGEMGECLLRKHGFEVELFDFAYQLKGTPEDTIMAAKAMKDRVDLLLFAGGDGTARDVCSVIGNEQLTLGIPCGVKIQSAVFAANVHKAAQIIKILTDKRVLHTQEAEVADIDEDAYRHNTLSSRLYGVMKVPAYKGYLQNRKSRTQPGEKYFQEAIAQDIIDGLQEGTYYLLGPGTTTQTLIGRLGQKGSLLGVDLLFNKKVVAADLGEKELLKWITGSPCQLIITPTGQQGFLLGRGNKQISPQVLHLIGKENILIAATKEKLIHLHGAPLLVDTGDDEVDEMLSGYYPVITGYQERLVYKVSS